MIKDATVSRLLIFLLFVLSACSGGGGSDSKVSTVNDTNEENTPVTDQSPTLNLVGDNPMNVTFKSAFIDPGATANDPEDGALAYSVNGIVNTQSAEQAFVLTYTTTDSDNNTVEVIRSVIVAANQAPTIALLGDNSVSILEGDDFESIDPGVVAIDVEDGDLLVAADYSAIDNTQVGDYNVTYSAADAEGQLVNINRIVKVNAALTSVTANIVASRNHCVSPCTIIFSAVDSEDIALPNEHERFKDLGYHFNFDDSTSGNHAITNLPRNSQTGGPIATHTFECATGTCTYDIGVRVQNSAGIFDDAFVKVTVDHDDTAYSDADTICVSISGTWTGDKPCPASATKQITPPALGSSSGKRILFRRGEVFPDVVCLGYSENNIFLGSFGDNADAKPELSGGIKIGVQDTNCTRHEVNNTEALALGSRWIENITVTDIRTPGISMGMSYYNVALHNIDADYFDQASGGFIQFAQSTSRCNKSSSLDCVNVPYPYGLYMSQLAVVGSEFEAINGDSHGGVIMAGYNCPLINWITLIDSEVWSANQHQFRLEGSQRISISHNNMRGITLGSTGGKHILTLRSCGYGDIDIGTAIVAGTGRHASDPGDINSPWTRWAVLADNFHGSADHVGGSFKLQIAPTSATKTETIVDAVVERTTFVSSPMSISTDLSLNGYYLTARNNNSYSGDSKGCQDAGPTANPVYGNIDCDGVAVPQPLAPSR